jgi:hypothetical protein
MIIVLIHWRIKPTDEAENAFVQFWTTMATINIKTHLAGEFLSAPLPANQFPFRVDDLFFGHGVLDCRHFINVGLWNDFESFNEQVGKYMRDDKPILPFEADRRTRTVLEPRHWRVGQWTLPGKGSCE